MQTAPSPRSHSLIRLFCLALAVNLGLAGCGETAQEAPAVDRGKELSKRFLLVDTHIDVPYRIHDEWEDVSVATEGGDFDHPRAVAGGLDSMFMSIYIPATVDEAGQAKGFAEGLIDSVEALAASAPEKFGVATCTADVLALKEAGRISLPMGMENGGPIEGSFENLSHFANRGIRYVSLAHSKSNHISDSSYDLNEQWQGLSEFGKTLIPEMNRQGVMIDVSHISDKAFWQVLELTQLPVIASHSSLRHYTPGFQRNMSDEMVAALGENGGVIQINFGSNFLTKAARDYSNASQQAMIRFRAEAAENLDAEKMAQFATNYRKENPYPYSTVDDVLDHIDRAVQLAGIDHVGIGSDYDGVGDTLPIGLKDVSEYPNLVNGLLERGYSEEDIEKIWGGNTMRVWAEAEAYAAAAGNATNCRL
ncbi:MAG: membrane dipeptidase [Gammaproteobacteria bacterium]|nr:MAG: membrane dipeptidase [Gammaproteobacteria bacterium]